MPRTITRAEAGRGVAVAHAVEAAGSGVAVIVAAKQAQAERPDCVGSRTCCCGHVLLAVSDPGAVRADPPNGRRVAARPDAARPSPAPEAIPEPPRPSA